MIGCFIEGKGLTTRFGPSLNFMYSFGFQFRRSFVIIPSVTFYLVEPLLLVGVFWWVCFFVCSCFLSFFLNESYAKTKDFFYLLYGQHFT